MPDLLSISYQPSTEGVNFYDADCSLVDLIGLYAPVDQRPVIEERLRALGALVGGRLDALARDADRHPPELEHRDREGRDRQRIVKHPSFVELERLAFEEFCIATVAHKPCFGHPELLHPIAKYALTYLFAQSEFGLLCPVSMTDSLTRTVRRYAGDDVLADVLPGLLSNDLDQLWQGAMFMTERQAGSDIAATETTAERHTDGGWRLWGDKWFCSNPDAAVALVLARVAGAGAGMSGIGLFVMPRFLPDGTVNRASIVRLKDKLGTRSMASGEITLQGATAWLVGDVGQGFQQIAEMMNQSRLSNAVRSAGMMRRACHEALAVARGRDAFGGRLVDKPLMQRQLLKLLLPTEEALALAVFCADMLARADAGDDEAAGCRRILTPLLKFRACRDARKVTGDAMEVRGGCGYIEEYIEPRLVRDSHLGSIWEGTSNIVALDVVRAARREQAHRHLEARLLPALAAAGSSPAASRLAPVAAEQLTAAVTLIDQVATDRERDIETREAATGLYRAAAAALLVIDGSRLDVEHGGQGRRLDLAALALHVRFGADLAHLGCTGSLASLSGRIIDTA